jgi:hypothetical protein
LKNSLLPLVEFYPSRLAVFISLLLAATKISDIDSQSLQVRRKGGLDTRPDQSAGISGLFENGLIRSVLGK